MCSFCSFLKVQLPHVLSNLVKIDTGIDEIWFNKISKIMDMNFISIKNHEMEICEILQTSLFSSKGPCTIHHTDSQPCTRPTFWYVVKADDPELGQYESVKCFAKIWFPPVPHLGPLGPMDTRLQGLDGSSVERIIRFWSCCLEVWSCWFLVEPSRPDPNPRQPDSESSFTFKNKSAGAPCGGRQAARNPV